MIVIILFVCVFEVCMAPSDSIFTSWIYILLVVLHIVSIGSRCGKSALVGYVL